MSPRPRVDPRIEDGRETDIIIALMGRTKAGKSSLINRLVQRDEMVVGEGMESCTKEIASTVLDPVPGHVPGLQSAIGGRRIVFLDTPGFDDTDMGDAEILVQIADWLTKSYRKQMHVGGILYLHDATDDSWTQTSRKNLTLFSKICGDDAMDLVGFVTTKWGNLQDAQVENAGRRITELMRKHWEPLIHSGARVYHLQAPSQLNRRIAGVEFQNPWTIIYKMVVSINALGVRDRILLLQDELVNQGRAIVESQAGRELRMSLEELSRHAKALRRATKAGGASDADMDAFQEQQRQVDRLTEQLANLKPSLGKRIGRIFRKILP